MKKMLTTFFDITGSVNFEFILQGQSSEPNLLSGNNEAVMWSRG
jgi:hypothetical protein